MERAPPGSGSLWTLAGALAGLATVALVYAAALARHDDPGLAALVELHRRWPAFLVLDTVPIVLALVGLLVGRNRAAEAELAALYAVVGPWSDGALADALLDPALIVDADGQVVAANRAAAPLFGRDDVIGLSIRQLLPDHERIDPTRAAARRATGAAPVGLEWRMSAVRPNGSTVSVAVSCAPASGHRVVYVVRPAEPEGVARPPADLEAERERLARERDEARDANQAKGAFLASLSHELRTPLNAILGYADLLRDEITEAGIPLQAEIDAVRGATKHLLALVSNVLDLSKIEAGRLSVVLEPVPLAPLLADVEATARPLAHANRNTLEVRIQEGLHAVRGDEMRLRQVLLNLVGNACKFTADGRVTVEVRHAPAAGGTGAVLIEVTDTGIGMSAEQVGRLFREFVQADARVQRKYGGTGLGLAISKRLVELMGGTIEVRSAPGAGSTFTVKLPFGSAAHHTLIPEVISRSTPSLPSTDLPLLVIDRRPPAVRERLRRDLAEVGLREVVWPTERDPVALGGLRPRAILVDHEPGDPLIDALATSPALDGVPIVALSADDATADVDDRIAWLTVPLDPKALIYALRQADRALAGALVIGEGPEAERLVAALAGRGWRTESARDAAAAAAVAERRRVACVIVADGSREPLPVPLARIPIAWIGEDGVPLVDDDATLVDFIELVSTRAEG